MKNYYYNPKTQDLTIFDTESKEMLVLERIEGIRVLTSSEIERPNGDEPVKKWANHNWNPETGKAKRPAKRRPAAESKTVRKCGYCHKTNHRGKDCPHKPTGKKKSDRTITCKNCGEKGHFDKTCPKKSEAPVEKPQDEMSDTQAQEMVKEMREDRKESDALEKAT